MSDQNLKAEKITKPIQLLAAWLAGLLAINSCFLIAAANLGAGKWESGALVIASILNVPVFLVAVFLLQTKFRPELQEDSYYSSYLSNKTNLPISISKNDLTLKDIYNKLEKLEQHEKFDLQKVNSESALHELIFGINHHLTDIESLKSKLSGKGIYKCTIFGPKEPPTARNISISQHLPSSVLKEVITLGKELGFESYNLFDNIQEEADEDVLLGSYGAAAYQLL